MKAHQLILAIDPALRTQILTYMQTDERPAYRAVIDSLAGQRKLRPQFILEKSRAQQAEWLTTQLSAKVNDPVAEQLFQIWLLKSQTQMLTTFLDAVGIAHDGKGQVDELPEEVTIEKAGDGIKALLEAFPAPQVALYLAVFQLQRPDGFPGLTEAIEANETVRILAPAK